MGILENYRKQRPAAIRGYLRVAILSSLFMVVITIMIVLGQRAQEAAGPSAIPSKPIARETHPEDSAPSPVAPGSASAWKLRTPAQERALLARIVDQAPLAVREHREAYYYLLNKVHRMTEAELDAQLDLSVGYGQFAHQADIVRGSVVEVKGHLLRLVETPLDPSKAGLPAVYEGQIMDRSLNVYSFRLTESPRPMFEPGKVQIKDARHVRLRGIFMQVVVYQNRAQKDVATPLILGRRLVDIPPVNRKSSWVWPTVLGGVVILVALRLGLTLLPRVKEREDHEGRN